MKKATFRLLHPSKMGPTGCPETSVTNYQYMLRKIPDERTSRLQGGNLKWCTIFQYSNYKTHNWRSKQDTESPKTERPFVHSIRTYETKRMIVELSLHVQAYRRIPKNSFINYPDRKEQSAWLSRYTDRTYRRGDPGFEINQGKKFFFSLKRPARL